MFLDVKKGLSYVGNIEKIYNNLLINFYNNYKNFIEDINNDFYNDYEAYKFKIHTLKGITLNIGASLLYEYIDDYEKKNINSSFHNYFMIVFENTFSELVLYLEKNNLLDNKSAI